MSGTHVSLGTGDLVAVAEQGQALDVEGDVSVGAEHDGVDEPVPYFPVDECVAVVECDSRLLQRLKNSLLYLDRVWREL